jgi:hypothetical protein
LFGIDTSETKLDYQDSRSGHRSPLGIAAPPEKEKFSCGRLLSGDVRQTQRHNAIIVMNRPSHHFTAVAAPDNPRILLADFRRIEGASVRHRGRCD